MTQWAQGPEQRDQLVLLTQRLDDALSPEHSVRQFDEILSQLDWSAWEAHDYGRPRVDSSRIPCFEKPRFRPY